MHECSPNRSYRLAATDFINISYGIQAENKNNVTKVNVPAPNWRQPQPQQNQRQHQQQDNQVPAFWLSMKQQHQQQHQQPQQQQKQFYQPPAMRSPAKQRPGQMQPPDPSTLNSFYPPFSNSNQNKNLQQQKQEKLTRIQSHDSPKHVKKEPQQQFPDAPNILHKFTDGKKLMPPGLHNTQQPSKLQSSEFQDLWNELNKIPVSIIFFIFFFLMIKIKIYSVFESKVFFINF